MNISSIVKLIAYLLPLIFLLIGFLLGLWKGGKKAGVRIAVFLPFALLTFVFSQMITKTLIGINVTVDGTTRSISQLIEKYILEIDKVAYFYNMSESFAQIVHNMPVAIANIAVFVVLLYIFSFIGWVVYLILAAIFLKNKSKPYVIKDGKAHISSQIEKPKKHRLVGGAIGAVQALILVFLTFMPLSAGASTLGALINSTNDNVIYALEDTENVEYTPTGKMLRESLPKEAIEIVNVFNSTVPSKIYSFAGIDKLCFDALTTVKVGDEKIVLRKEVNNFAKVYDNIEFLTKFDFKNGKYKNINFDKIETALDCLFESGFLKSMLPDAVELVLKDVVSENPTLGITVPQESLRYIKAIYDEILSGDKKDTSFYKSEFFSVFGVVKAIAQSGIADELVQEQIDIDKVMKLVNQDNRLVLTNVNNNLFESKIVKAVLVEGLNSLLEKADNYDKTVTIPQIDKSLINWSQVKVNLTSVENSILNIYDNFNTNVDGNVKDIPSKPQLLLNLDIDQFTSNLVAVMNKFQNSALLVSTSGEHAIYDSLIDIFENTEYSKYADLTVFKQENKWNEELGYLNKALNGIKNSGVSTAVAQNKVDTKLVIDDLAKKDEKTNKTYIRQIVESLLDSKAFARTVSNLGFGYVDSLIQTYQGQLGENVVLGKVQSQKLSEQNQKELVVAFFENIIVYAQDLNLDEMKSDAFAAIVSSNLASLGNALDTIKESALFGPYQEDENENQGIYKNLIKALAENPNFNKFADFELALDETFTWNQELSLLQDAITVLNKININVDGQEKPIITAIKDGDDLTKIFESLSTENDDIDNIVLPLSQSKLMKKNLKTIIDTMNVKLSEILSLSQEISPIPENTDFYAQRENISQTIKQLVEVYDAVKDGFDQTKLESNYDKIGNLLNTLMYSKNNSGVFAGTYDGFMEYLSTTDYSEKIQYLLSQYVNSEKIDWVQILDVAIEAQKYDGTSINVSLKQKISNLVGTVYADEECKEITQSLVNIANSFLGINNETDSNTALDTAINAFATLEQYNDKTQKVNKVCDFISNMTGVTKLDDLKSVTNYTTQKQSLIDLKNKINTVESGPTAIDDVKAVVDILADNDVIVNLLAENDINVTINELIKSETKKYIEENVTNTDVAAKIKQILEII